MAKTLKCLLNSEIQEAYVIWYDEEPPNNLEFKKTIDLKAIYSYLKSNKI
jgi:hypothetical protein